MSNIPGRRNGLFETGSAIKLMLALLLYAGGAFASWAQTNSNFYLKVDSGVAIQPDVRQKYLPNARLGYTEYHFDVPIDAGVRIDLAGGYRFNDWLAGELEAGVVYSTINFSSNFRRDYFQLPLLANCILTYPHGKWRPFIGGGAGMVEVVLNPREDASLVENHTTFGCQAIAGMTYPITRRLDFGINYKFLYSSPFTIYGHYYNIPNVEMGPGMSHSIAAAFVFHF